HIEAGAAGIEDFHDIFPARARRRPGASAGGTLENVSGSIAAPWHSRGSRKLPIQLTNGFGCTERRPISTLAAHSHLATDAKAFHIRWVGSGPGGKLMRET